MKCACPDCLCIVNLSEAVMTEGKVYCGEACPQGRSRVEKFQYKSPHSLTAL